MAGGTPHTEEPWYKREERKLDDVSPEETEPSLKVSRSRLFPEGHHLVTGAEVPTMFDSWTSFSWLIRWKDKVDTYIYTLHIIEIRVGTPN